MEVHKYVTVKMREIGTLTKVTAPQIVRCDIALLLSAGCNH